MKNLQKNENYYLALDLGTNSVGWAVFTDEYLLARVKGRNMWGVNLFDEGQPASKRRSQRSARRRLERRKQRIALLQTLMQDDVLKADGSVYIKLKESFLNNGDFGRTNKFNLFEDASFTDKDFYRQYPTIYHLRKALIEDTQKFDIRLVYLAIHHMIKYRGNFLYEGDAENFKGYDKNYIANYFDELVEINEANFVFADKIDEIEAILLDTSKRRKEKADGIKSLFSAKEDKAIAAQFANAALGMKFDLGCVCLNDDIKQDNGKPVKFSFNDGDYEENSSQYIQAAGERAPLLGALHKLYFSLTFKEILGKNDYISHAMCDKYNCHRQDLMTIKDLMQDYCAKNTYGDIFISNRENAGKNVCYYNYINRIDRLKDKTKPSKTANEAIIDKAFELIEKTDKREQLERDERYLELKRQRELRELLPKLNSKVNAATPYQMHCKELQIILNNQGKYYPTLKDNAKKIISLLTFRRPYYVGVLDKNSKFNWYKPEKEIDGKVYPWNFEEKVNLELAQQQFIENLTNNCSIFWDQPVLPMNSFLYSEYTVLDELNKIKIKDRPLSADIKNKMFQDLFCSEFAKAKVGKKDIVAWHAKNTGVSITANDVSGLRDTDFFANIYRPHRDFKRILGSAFDEKKIDVYEKIVHTLTVFSDAKTRSQRIQKYLANEIENKTVDEKQIESLAKLNYKGWGRFSKKVLNGIYSAEENRRTIIQIMRDTTQNFMEISWDKKYGFQAQMQPQKQDVEDFYHDCIETAYCSPAVKKSVWQAVKIIREVIEIIGRAPTEVFVESADGDDLNKKNKRAKSRGDGLKEIYNNADKVIQDAYFLKTKEELKQLSDSEKSRGVKAIQSRFNRDKVYLYFAQCGKCMYSGTPLDFERLDSYEIDHIIPRSLIKDDSIENKVLVKKIQNQDKADSLLLSKDTVANMKPFWAMLLKNKFIGKKKYDALTRETFDERDVERFIDRQLTETRQTVKEVCNILNYLPQLSQNDCKPIKVKARLCDDLKTALGYYKVRELNDYHHAKDAYIAGVLGRFTLATVAQNNGDFRKEYAKKIFENEKRYGEGKNDRLRNGVVVDMMNLKIDSILHTADAEFDESGNIVKDELQILSKEGEVIWSSAYLENVKRTLNYNDCMLTKKKEECANGEFYNQTVCEKAKSDKAIPRKMIRDKASGQLLPLPPEKYGYYTSVNPAYAMAIEYKKRKKTEKAIVNIPLIEVYRNNVDGYLKKEYGEYRVLKDKIFKNQMVKYKGQLCYLASASELNNATQIKGDRSWQKALSEITKARSKNQYLIEANLKDAELAKINAQMRLFVDGYLKQMKENFPLYDKEREAIEAYVQKGGFDALSFENKQSFVLDLMKIVSAKCRVENMNKYAVVVNGETLTVKGSSLGRLTLTLDVDDIEFVNRSVTGFWQQKEKI